MGQSARRVKAWATTNGFPVIYCKAGECKHLIAEEHLAAHPPSRPGVFLVLAPTAGLATATRSTRPEYSHNLLFRSGTQMEDLVCRDGHWCVYGLRAVLDGHTGEEPVLLSEVRQRVRSRRHSSATRIAEVLADMGLLHDDTTVAIRTWIERRTVTAQRLQDRVDVAGGDLPQVAACYCPVLANTGAPPGRTPPTGTS